MSSPRHVKRCGATQRAYVVKPYPAEARYGVAGRVRLRNPNAPVPQRVLQRLHALLRVVVRHHRKVAGGGRRRWSGGNLQCGPRVRGEQPRRENRAAAAAVEGVGAAGLVDAAEELVGEVEVADLGVGLKGE